MKKQKSEQAQVAAIIKKSLKARGIPCKAKSESFTGGDSVRIKMMDIPADTLEGIKKEFSKYQEGRFDGMRDIYEYNNADNTIPQTKYLFISSDYSDEVRQAAWNWFKATFGGDDVAAAPDNIADLGQYLDKVLGFYAVDILLRILSGSVTTSERESFWDHWRGTNQDSTAPQAKPEPVTECDSTNSHAAIVRTNPNKNGLEVEFTGKPSADIRDQLKAAGFRWSRNLGYWYAKQTAEALALAELLGLKQENVVTH